ncbi:alpha/beta hydrolase [Streptomyces sioyaensis]|uniref:alpha/beta hydrolase n=1 Tax=Streptomyces sioyaensis TaxID=67364 RepID=UPI0037883E89
MYVHPDLEPVLAALPERSMFGNIPRAREGLRRSMATRAPYDDPRLSIEDAVATGPDGSEVPVRLYRPTGAQGPLPAVLFFHGGGFVLGDLDGHSAGACLCAGLTLRARDEGGPALAFQQLLLPALDDRADGGSRTDIDEPRVLNGNSKFRMPRPDRTTAGARALPSENMAAPLLDFHGGDPRYAVGVSIAAENSSPAER